MACSILDEIKANSFSFDINYCCFVVISKLDQ